MRFSEALETLSDIDALCQSPYFKGETNQNESNQCPGKQKGNCRFWMNYVSLRCENNNSRPEKCCCPDSSSTHALSLPRYCNISTTKMPWIVCLGFEIMLRFSWLQPAIRMVFMCSNFPARQCVFVWFCIQNNEPDRGWRWVEPGWCKYTEYWYCPSWYWERASLYMERYWKFHPFAYLANG